MYPDLISVTGIELRVPATWLVLGAEITASLKPSIRDPLIATGVPPDCSTEAVPVVSVLTL